MNKRGLDQKTTAVIEETRAALQTVYDALNQGQQQKLVKDPAVATLFERYAVVTAGKRANEEQEEAE